MEIRIAKEASQDIKYQSRDVDAWYECQFYTAKAQAYIPNYRNIPIWQLYIDNRDPEEVVSLCIKISEVTWDLCFMPCWVNQTREKLFDANNNNNKTIMNNPCGYRGSFQIQAATHVAFPLVHTKSTSFGGSWPIVGPNATFYPS